jgi:hypothetical protein
LISVSFVLSPMSTWLEQKPIKNHWQPLPHQTALFPTGALVRGTKKKSLSGVKNNILIAISVSLEQGNLLSQRAPFCLFATPRFLRILFPFCDNLYGHLSGGRLSRATGCFPLPLLPPPSSEIFAHEPVRSHTTAAPGGNCKSHSTSIKNVQEKTRQLCK